MTVYNAKLANKSLNEHLYRGLVKNLPDLCGPLLNSSWEYWKSWRWSNYVKPYKFQLISGSAQANPKIWKTVPPYFIDSIAGKNQLR